MKSILLTAPVLVCRNRKEVAAVRALFPETAANITGNQVQFTMPITLSRKDVVAAVIAFPTSRQGDQAEPSQNKRQAD